MLTPQSQITHFFAYTIQSIGDEDALKAALNHAPLYHQEDPCTIPCIRIGWIWAMNDTRI